MEKHGDKMDEICGHIFEHGPADSGKDKEFIGKLAEYAKILISNNNTLFLITKTVIVKQLFLVVVLARTSKVT